jgi:hypothetical protein
MEVTHSSKMLVHEVTTQKNYIPHVTAIRASNLRYYGHYEAMRIECHSRKLVRRTYFYDVASRRSGF